MISRSTYPILVLGVVMPCMDARAFEDMHPPIQLTPVEEVVIGQKPGAELVRLGFDPRGIGLVATAGDDDACWVKTEDDAGAWHYREWQWWKGHPWGESCRPRYYADVDFKPLRNEHRGALISYDVDGFHCRQAFFVSEVENTDAPYWDVVATINNESGRDVEEYGQFYACYTQTNRDLSFWYWDLTGKLIRFADRGVGHLDGYIANPSAYFCQSGAIPHCPRGGGRIVGHFQKPVIVSQSSPAGWRSVILIEVAFAAALTQGIQGKAMDYILFPSAQQRTLEDGQGFSVHIRHVMLKSPKLPTTRRLDELWTEFEHDHARAKDLAARF